jgi:hypothetical protein
MKTYSFSDVDARYKDINNCTEFDKAVEFASYVLEPGLPNWVGTPPSEDLVNLAKQFLALTKGNK